MDPRNRLVLLVSLQKRSEKSAIPIISWNHSCQPEFKYAVVVRLTRTSGVLLIRELIISHILIYKQSSQENLFSTLSQQGPNWKSWHGEKTAS